MEDNARHVVNTGSIDTWTTWFLVDGEVDRIEMTVGDIEDAHQLAYQLDAKVFWRRGQENRHSKTWDWHAYRTQWVHTPGKVRKQYISTKTIRSPDMAAVEMFCRMMAGAL